MVSTQSGDQRLIPDELDILMTAVGQRHHEGPGAPGLAVGVDGAGAEVDLCGLAGVEVEPTGGLGDSWLRMSAARRRTAK